MSQIEKKQMKQVKIRLKTLSSIILTPREQTMKTIIQENKTGYLYQFYHYGDTEDCGTKEYYIPGSSLKGAIGKENIKPNRLFVDDIRICPENIEVKQLQKIQNLGTEHAEKQIAPAIKAEIFFPMVYVEMLNPDVTVQGEMFCDGDLRSVFEQMHYQTIQRLKNWKDYRYAMITELSQNKSRRIQFEKETDIVAEKLEALVYRKDQKHYLMLLGGYKGKILMGVQNYKEKNELIPVSFFKDEKTSYPYGLTEIEIVEENDR